MPRRHFDGSSQERALRGLLERGPGGLHTRSGRSLTDVAQQLGLSYPTLWRYISGQVPLRSDQFGPFAQAFETDEDVLIRACLPAVRTMTLRDLLRAAEIPDDEIREVIGEIGSRDLTPEAVNAIAQIVVDGTRAFPRRDDCPRHATGR